MASIREFFESDFKDFKVGQNVVAQSRDGTKHSIKIEVVCDLDAGAQFVACFLPEDAPVEAMIGMLLRDIDEIIQRSGNALRISTDVFDDSRVTARNILWSNQLMFSRLVYVYCESIVPESVWIRVVESAKISQIRLILRDPDFARSRSKKIKPSAFISHDSRDKDTIARPLTQALQKRGIGVWYDEFSLKLGDSLRESVEKGLKESDKCILILTPNFLSNEGWTKREFNAVFTREIIENSKRLLPVWCGVTREAVFEYSPTVADRLAAVWGGDVDALASQLAKNLNRIVF